MTEPRTTMPKVGVIAHAKKRLGGAPIALRQSLADAGVEIERWCEIGKSKHAPKAVRELLEHDVQRVLVWGGDGTVRRCIDTIVDADAHPEVAIIPAGTANLLAHALGVPIDLEQSIDVALHGVTRHIDIGSINGERFAVMAGTGFDALLIRDADADKPRLGRLAYLSAGVRNLGADGVAARITVDGHRWFDGEASCVLVGNVGRIMGGVRAFPNARLDDGLLDVGVVTAHGVRDWVRIGARAIANNVDASPLVEMTQGVTIHIRLDTARPWELDGGARPKRRRFDIDVLPSRIAVRTPAS